MDLSRLLPGPLATMHLADLGAEVIKVESPAKADYLRFLEPHYKGQNIGFSVLNRGKKSVVLAFEEEPGTALLLQLLQRCDVLLESFRPGYLSRFGLDYETVRKSHPGIVYCSITAFGQNSSRAGHDLNCLAVSGLTDSLTGVGGPPVPKTQLADVTCGLAAGNAILAALFARERSGEGTYLDVSMVEAAYHLVMLDSASARHGVGAFHGGHLTGEKPYYRHYRCADGRYLAVAAVEEKFQTIVLQALGLDDWDGAEEVFLSRDLSHWLELLTPLDCCVEPVLEAGEVLASQWMRERFGDWETPPALHQASFGEVQADCALPGQHTAEVLGLDEARLAELSRLGVVAASV